ncbi:MAG: PIN domain-containing protein [Actinobacteria bacterium]|nr:PIN domain-containing protein [Actinomycetota bacterium]
MTFYIRIPLSIKERLLFIDTSAYYASIDKSDAHHKIAIQFFALIEKEGLRPVTSNFVLAESHTLIINNPRLGYWAASLFLEKINSSEKKPERISENDEERAYEIIVKYKDKDFTYTDATSFALMERLGITRVFTFDSHFSQYGFTTITK